MFISPDPILYFSKNDPDDIRFGDLAKNKLNINDLKHQGFAVYGYPDDRGVKNNGGRIGAAEGPDVIRSLFYKMTNSPLKENLPEIFDMGNLQLTEDIGSTHELAIHNLSNLFESEHRFIALGGGHDFSYPDGKSFLKSHSNNKKPIIINFDAHLDCRPLQGEINSGTPFYRLLEEHSTEFHFIEVGLQAQCNSKKHFDWAKQKGMHSIWLEEINNDENNLLAKLKSICSDMEENSPLYLSIDLDAFSSAYAPGCSQSWPSGLSPEQCLPCFEWLYKQYDCKLLGIYEYAPRLDIDHRTARLAAKLMHHFIDSHI